jgi:predicted membrane channel-forming protein YqfA (hemolysin III family)
MTVATGSRQHRAGELAADRIIHIMGTLAGVVGSAILVCIAVLTADRRVFYASLVYSVCLLMMLACSAAYQSVQRISTRPSVPT